MVDMQKIDRTLEKIGMEWTYVLWSPNFLYRVKSGRSTQFNVRIRDIAQTMSDETGRTIKVYAFFKMPMFWAGKAEKAIQNSALWRSAGGMPGSGRTEWAYVLNVYSFIISYILLWGFGLPLHFSILFLVAPLPLDIAVFVLLIAIAQYAFVGLLAYGLWNLIF